MKKILPFFFSCLVSALSYAQPSFTNVTVPTEGYSYLTSGMSYLGTDPAADHGANLSWDYSSLNFAASGTVTTLHTDMSSATYSGFFPAATHYLKNMSNYEYYYQVSSTSRSELGLQNGTSVIKYTNPLILFSYPIAYTDVQSRTYDCSFTQNSYPSTLNGTLSTTYDGYGTLTLGSDVINNIGRYKIVRNETIGTSFGSANFLTTTYAWYLPGEYSPRFAIESVVTTVDGNPYSSTHNAYKYTETITTGVSKPEEINASLYPQPASGQVTIEVPGMMGTSVYSIYKTDGTAVKKEEVETDSAGSMTINVSSIPSGLYVIEIVNGNKVVKQKLMVK